MFYTIYIHGPFGEPSRRAETEKLPVEAKTRAAPATSSIAALTSAHLRATTPKGPSTTIVHTQAPKS